MRYTVLTNGKGGYLVMDTMRLRLQNMRRRIFAWSKVIAIFIAQGRYKMTMYGLTYDTKGTLVKASEWEPNDIREFIIRLKARMGGRLIAYAWVAEKQKRGVIHYHVVIVHQGRAPMPDRAYRSKNSRGQERYFKRLWEKGNSHSDFDVRSPYYLASYVGKEYQKDFETFPKYAHAWAVWVSDTACKKDLKFESLTSYKKQYFAEVMLREGIGFEEAWELVEWELQTKKIIEKEMGVGWRYLGQVQDASGLAMWGVTAADLQGKMVNKVQGLSVEG